MLALYNHYQCWVVYTQKEQHTCMRMYRAHHIETIIEFFSIVSGQANLLSYFRHFTFGDSNEVLITFLSIRTWYSIHVSTAHIHVFGQRVDSDNDASTQPACTLNCLLLSCDIPSHFYFRSPELFSNLNIIFTFWVVVSQRWKQSVSIS